MSQTVLTEPLHPIRIAVLRTLPAPVLQELARIGTVVAPAGAVALGDEVTALISQADAMLATPSDIISSEFLALAPKLKWISSIGVGLDHVDLAACEKAGVAVANTPSAVTEPTADHTFALMLAAARRIVDCDAFVRAGKWTATNAGPWGLDLFGRRLGIIGMGRIGKAVARRAAGFGMDIVYHDRFAIPADAGLPFAATLLPLDDLLATSDFITLHAPLMADNHHLVGAREMALMRANAILINAGRGGLVHEDALVDALDEGRLAHAALDVVEGEPEVNPRLLACAKVTLTPHVGTATQATRGAMAAEALGNLRALIARN